MTGPGAIVREVRASSVTRAAWTVATTAATSQIAADTQRVRILMVNTSTGRVWINISALAPTSTVFDWYLDAGERWEVSAELAQLAQSFLGQAANGTLLYCLAVTP